MQIQNIEKIEQAIETYNSFINILNNDFERFKLRVQHF